MKILLFLVIIGIAAFIIMAVKGYADKEKYEEPEEPLQPPRQLSEAEREAIRQAEDVFDYETRAAILNGTFEGKLPEYDGYHWTDMYPNIYHLQNSEYCNGNTVRDVYSRYAWSYRSLSI